jgi:hypothetical protein
MDYGYRIVDGRIADLGKFEGEPEWAPYFYENAADGEELSWFEGGMGEYVSLVLIGDADAAEYPELAPHIGCYVVVAESDNGFVSTSIVSEHEAENLRAEYAADQETSDD